MRQLEFANIPIEGWIIGPDVHGLLDGPCDVLCLLTYYGEVVHPGVMTSGVGMAIDGGRGLQCSLSLSQRSLQIPLCTPHHTPVCHTCTCRLLHFSV